MDCFNHCPGTFIYMITKQERKAFWIRYWKIILNWTSLSLLAFLSTAIIWAHILKHVFKWKTEFWILNDTVDGDYGADWWLKEKGHKKRNLWTAFNWWFRNHSWNWIRYFNPQWKAGEVDKDENGNDIFSVLKSTIDTSGENGRFSRADKYNKGVHSIAYKINGITFCQYSKANWLFTFQIGTGGSEWRYRSKLNIF